MMEAVPAAVFPGRTVQTSVAEHRRLNTVHALFRNAESSARGQRPAETCEPGRVRTEPVPQRRTLEYRQTETNDSSAIDFIAMTPFILSDQTADSAEISSYSTRCESDVA